MTSKKVTCIITGSSYIFSTEYYKKKVAEYKDEDNLKKYFILKKAKSLLDRGFSVQEVRKHLDIDDSQLMDCDAQPIQALIAFHKIQKPNSSKKVESTLNFATHKSDDDVARFINNIRNYE